MSDRVKFAGLALVGGLLLSGSVSAQEHPEGYWTTNLEGDAAEAVGASNGSEPFLGLTLVDGLASMILMPMPEDDEAENLSFCRWTGRLEANEQLASRLQSVEVEGEPGIECPAQVSLQVSVDGVLMDATISEWDAQVELTQSSGPELPLPWPESLPPEGIRGAKLGLDANLARFALLGNGYTKTYSSSHLAMWKAAEGINEIDGSELLTDNITVRWRTGDQTFADEDMLGAVVEIFRQWEPTEFGRSFSIEVLKEAAERKYGLPSLDAFGSPNELDVTFGKRLVNGEITAGPCDGALTFLDAREEGYASAARGNGCIYEFRIEASGREEVRSVRFFLRDFLSEFVVSWRRDRQETVRLLRNDLDLSPAQQDVEDIMDDL